MPRSEGKRLSCGAGGEGLFCHSGNGSPLFPMLSTQGETLTPSCPLLEDLPCRNHSSGEVSGGPQPGPVMQPLLRRLRQAHSVPESEEKRLSGRTRKEGLCLLCSPSVPVQGPPSTWPDIGLFYPGELCWTYPDDSLRPFPATKYGGSQTGGSLLSCTLRYFPEWPKTQHWHQV